MFWKKLFGKNKDNKDEVLAPEEDVQEQQKEAEEQTQESEQEQGFFKRLQVGLSKTRQGLVDQVDRMIVGRKIDDELFDDLEEILIQADCGVQTAIDLVERLRDRVISEKATEGEQVKHIFQEEIATILQKNSTPLKTPTETPYVVMVVGVNGAGKTTTIGKLAYRFKQEGAKVLLGAGDTFRAAAIDQLKVWAERVGVDFIAHQEGSDPAALAYDAVNAAKSREVDILILDTAGRLQTKTNLMAELGKVHRVVQRELGRPVDEILLVVDATTGQNALSQGKIFNESVPVTGIVLTKLDGTAKGGIVLALTNELQLPVKLIGVGEQYTDLQDFDAKAFVDALFN